MPNSRLSSSTLLELFPMWRGIVAECGPNCVRNDKRPESPFQDHSSYNSAPRFELPHSLDALSFCKIHPFETNVDMEKWLINKPAVGRADDKQKGRTRSRHLKPYSKSNEKYVRDYSDFEAKPTTCTSGLHYTSTPVNRSHPPPSRNICSTPCPMNQIPSPTLISTPVLVRNEWVFNGDN